MRLRPATVSRVSHDHHQRSTPAAALLSSCVFSSQLVLSSKLLRVSMPRIASAAIAAPAGTAAVGATGAAAGATSGGVPLVGTAEARPLERRLAAASESLKAASRFARRRLRSVSFAARS